MARTLDMQDNCVLGEGLYVTGSRVSWIDIANRVLYLKDSIQLTARPLPVEATAILDDDGASLLLASPDGLGLLDTRSDAFKVVSKYTDELCSEGYRTNDGCQLSDGRILVGTMHRQNPSENAGSVALIEANGSLHRVVEGIHIPNAFVELADGSVLIADSLQGKINSYRLEELPGRLSASLWHQAESGVSPDGGCTLPGGRVAIALWDGGCVRVFDQSGAVLQDIDVPVPRPTNVKYDAQSQSLWVTSASDGLSSRDIADYPLSGHTFQIPDPMGRPCH